MFTKKRHSLPVSRRIVVAGMAAMVPGCVIAPSRSTELEDAGAEEGINTVIDGGPTPQCLETEDNILGPFYRANAPLRDNLMEPGDVTKLVIEGTVRGLDCGLLSQALLDIWHANEAGEYDNATFKWRGRLSTGNDGAYRVVTTLPGRYLNGNTYRPRHLHLRVSASQHQLLTTQLYFENDPYLSSDSFVRPSLVVPLTEVNGEQRAQFDIVLAPS